MAGRYAQSLDTPEKRREYDRQRKADYREIRHIGLRGKAFVGVDGEGGNDSEGHHQYYLLTAGEAKIASGKPLTPQECLTFISRLSPDVYYVGYFFDYDVTMILRKLPAEKIARLLDRVCRTKNVTSTRQYTYPIDWNGFQIDYLPHKEFKVRRVTGIDANGKRSYSPWIVINDVGTFFQCSFVKALTQWEIATPEEMEQIAAGKDMRADFGQLTKNVIEYNALEIVLLQRLMTAFREVCEDIGYIPSRWQGPGNLASAMLRYHGVIKSKDLEIAPEILEAAGAAYYGGRFETTAAGTLPGPIYAYDINSAYPDALTKLPCLEHGTWEQTAPLPPGVALEGVLYLAHGAYDIDRAGIRYPTLYNFPHRTRQGQIFYPRAGSGWYWSVEIEQAAHQIFTADTMYVYRKNCDCTPFDWVPAIYDLRISLGKTKKGGVLKLGLNSLYGKMAQSIGAAPYANPIWAGLITALTRAKLSSISHLVDKPTADDIAYDLFDGKCLCEKIYMLATDAVFTDTPLEIDESKLLGDWGLDVHEELHIIQPGLYFTSADNQPKTRGVPRQLIVERKDEFYAKYDEFARGEIPIGECKITVPLKQFIGLKIANHRNRLDLAGEWLWCGEDGRGKDVSYDWKNKRNKKGRVDKKIGATFTQPYYMDAGETVPYSKDIGRMMEAQRLNGGFDGAPDWAANLMDADL